MSNVEQTPESEEPQSQEVTGESEQLAEEPQPQEPTGEGEQPAEEPAGESEPQGEGTATETTGGE